MADISIVIPVHNGMPHLPATLDSVLAQTRPADEVVVVENGSTDGTAEWLASAELPAQVRVVVQPELVPAAENWTRAVSEARCELVKLLCADDLIAPTALAAQEAALQRTGAVLAASRRQIVDDAGRPVARARGLGPLRGETPGREVVRRCALRGQNLLGEPSAVLFRRDALVRHLPWDASLPYLIDLDMYARVLQDGSAVVTREPLATFRLATGSWSSRLAGVQLEQFNAWRDRAEAQGLLSLGRFSRTRARLAARVQHGLRLAAYAVTARRGAS